MVKTGIRSFGAGAHGVGHDHEAVPDQAPGAPHPRFMRDGAATPDVGTPSDGQRRIRGRGTGIWPVG